MDARALVKVLGFDPGFASFGYVVASIPRQIDDVVFEEAGCMKTRRDSEVSAAQDLTTRARFLSEAMAHNFEKGGGIFAVCIEGMSYPRHTQAAVKLGCANGVLGAKLAAWAPEVVYIEQPQAIRKAVLDVTVGRTPTEEDVHAHLRARYPELDQLLEDNNKGDRPHALDAAAAVVAAFKKGILR